MAKWEAMTMRALFMELALLFPLGLSQYVQYLCHIGTVVLAKNGAS